MRYVASVLKTASGSCWVYVGWTAAFRVTDRASIWESVERLNNVLASSLQECDKFAKAFKDPEFMKLFEEYAKEVSDPKVQQG